MRVHDKLHTYIYMKKRSVYICSGKDSLHGVCVCICMPGGLLIKTIRHCKQANGSTFM